MSREVGEVEQLENGSAVFARTHTLACSKFGMIPLPFLVSQTPVDGSDHSITICFDFISVVGLLSNLHARDRRLRARKRDSSSL